MRTNLTMTAAVLAIIATVAPAPARAQDGMSADAIQEKSSQLYRKARALHTDAKWAEAEAAYQAAWDLRKTFDIAGNLGACELHVGQPREAAEHLTYALANFPAGGTSQQKDALNQRIQEARRQVGTARVRVNVSGAEILVDGRSVSELPDGLVFVDPGTRIIEARHAGYESNRRTITVQAGSAQDVSIALVASQIAAPPARPIWPVIVGGSLTAVLLGSGIASTVVSNAKRSDATGFQNTVDASHTLCGHTEQIPKRARA